MYKNEMTQYSSHSNKHSQFFSQQVGTISIHSSNLWFSSHLKNKTTDKKSSLWDSTASYDVMIYWNAREELHAMTTLKAFN